MQSLRRKGSKILIMALILGLSVQALLPVLDTAAEPAERSRQVLFDIVGVLSPTDRYDEHYIGMFPLLVQNKGDEEGNGTITVTDLPATWEWKVVEGQDILTSIDPDKTVRVTVQLCADAPAHGTYPFAVEIDPGTGPLHLEATVSFPADFSLESTPTVFGEHVEGTDVVVKVTNNAVGPDRFSLDVICPSTDWSYGTVPGPLSPYIEVGDSFNWSVHLDMSHNVEASIESKYGYQVLFRALSEGDQETSAMSLTMVRVGQYHDLHLDLEEDRVLYEEGSPFAEVTAVLDNLGNGPEEVDLSVGLSSGWKVQYSQKSFSLYAFQRVFVPIYIAPLEEVVAGNYPVTLTVTPANTSGMSPVKRTFTIVVPQRHGIYLPLTGVSGIPGTAPGGTVEVGFKVHNRGNHLELVELLSNSTPVGWKMSVTPSVVSLPAGATADARARITASEEAMEALEGRHAMKVMARSLWTGQEAILPLHVDVKAEAGLKLEVDTPVRSVNPLLDPMPVFIFSLRNSGNAEVVADLDFYSHTGRAGWMYPSQESAGLLPGETARFFVTMDPSQEGTGYHQFTVSAVTDDGGGAAASTVFGLQLLERDIGLVDLEASADGDVTAWVECTGSDIDEHFVVIFDLFVDGKAQDQRTKRFDPALGRAGQGFKVDLDEGTHNVTVRVRTPGDSDAENNELSRKVTVEPATNMVRTGAAATGVAMTATVILFASILTNEGWKFKALLLFVVPLYTRIKKEATLDNFTRGRIYGYIEANPGEHYSAIKKALALPNGCLAYHIQTLLRGGYIKFEMDGTYKRFYPKHMRIRKDGKATIRPGYLSKMQEIIIDKIKEVPGISQRQIARALNLAPSTINYHVRMLAMAGVLRFERSLGRTKCFFEKEPEFDTGDGSEEETAGP
jgi:predicted transcriptional regulator/uncharacterized membrane protein